MCSLCMWSTAWLSGTEAIYWECIEPLSVCGALWVSGVQSKVEVTAQDVNERHWIAVNEKHWIAVNTGHWIAVKVKCRTQ